MEKIIHPNFEISFKKVQTLYLTTIKENNIVVELLLTEKEKNSLIQKVKTVF